MPRFSPSLAVGFLLCGTLTANAQFADPSQELSAEDVARLLAPVSEENDQEATEQPAQKVEPQRVTSQTVHQPERPQVEQPEQIQRRNREHRPMVRIRSKESKESVARADKAVKPEEENFRFPSLAFLSWFDPWKLKIGDVTLLQDNYASLKRKHPDCRRLEVSQGGVTGRIACAKPSEFLAEGDAVIFHYIPVNDLLVGAVYSFSSQQRALQFASSIKAQLKAQKIESFTEAADADREVTDTPLFSLAVHPSRNGYLVSVSGHFAERFEDAEVYAAARLPKIEFGNLTLGVTTAKALPELPKSCTEVSAEPGGLRREFYGICFGFPYEAHMQLNFNPETDILETAVLSPIGAATGSLVEDMLRKRWNMPTYCPRMTTETELVTIKDERQRGKVRTRRVKGRGASVYAGTCEHPVIYTLDMRYVFENRLLNKEDIATDFERRRNRIQAIKDHDKAFDARMQHVKGFFE